MIYLLSLRGQANFNTFIFAPIAPKGFESWVLCQTCHRDMSTTEVQASLVCR